MACLKTSLLAHLKYHQLHLSDRQVASVQLWVLRMPFSAIPFVFTLAWMRGCSEVRFSLFLSKKSSSSSNHEKGETFHDAIIADKQWSQLLKQVHISQRIMRSIGSVYIGIGTVAAIWHISASFPRNITTTNYYYYYWNFICFVFFKHTNLPLIMRIFINSDEQFVKKKMQIGLWPCTLNKSRILGGQTSS